MNASEPLATVSLSEPGDLIAATPALLGFVPRSSLVAMSLGGASGRRLGLTLRIDLPPPEHVPEAAENVVGGVLLDHPAAVVVIVIGPGGDAGPPAVEFVERVVAGLAEHGVNACHALWAGSTAAGSRWRCYGECLCTGLVPPSSTSPLMAAARAEGRVVRADRSELERLVAPGDEQVLRRREALLDATVDAEADATFAAFADFATTPAAPATPATTMPSASAPSATGSAVSDVVATRADPVTDAAEGATAAGADAFAGLRRTATAPDAGGRRVGERRLRERWVDPRIEVIEGIAVLDAALAAAEEALGAVRGGSTVAERESDPARASEGGDAPGGSEGGAVPGGSAAVGADGWLDDERVVALTRALQIPVVRDAAVAACTGSRPAAAEALWAALARGTPDPEAAEPAALLALMGLLQGDGALANVALRRAESAWPGHHLTETLRGLAAAGIRPSELRACLTGAPVPPRDRQRWKATAPRRRGAPRPTRRRKRRR
jgi:Domain of unknown function (DUF4192)